MTDRISQEEQWAKSAYEIENGLRETPEFWSSNQLGKKRRWEARSTEVPLFPCVYVQGLLGGRLPSSLQAALDIYDFSSAQKFDISFVGSRTQSVPETPGLGEADSC